MAGVLKHVNPDPLIGKGRFILVALEGPLLDSRANPGGWGPFRTPARPEPGSETDPSHPTIRSSLRMKRPCRNRDSSITVNGGKLGPRMKGRSMPKKNASRGVVRRSAGNIPSTSPAHLSDLLAAMDGPIDTSDIPETKGTAARVRRDESGKLPQRRPSPIREAILAELGRRKMTRYQLWQEARAHCPTLPQSAVYEFLRGQRDIGLSYVDALLLAAGLVVMRPRGTPAKARQT